MKKKKKAWAELWYMGERQSSGKQGCDANPALFEKFVVTQGKGGG